MVTVLRYVPGRQERPGFDLLSKASHFFSVCQAVELLLNLEHDSRFKVVVSLNGQIYTNKNSAEDKSRTLDR